MATTLHPLESPRELRETKPVHARRKIVRRSGKDSAQLLRRWIQGIFLALNLLIGTQFYFFVRHFENGGQSPALDRPPGVEGWLPIAGMMNLKYFLLTGNIPRIHPAAMFLLIAFLAICFLFRKAFCSWLCPVGTLSELLWKMGRKILGRNWILPRGVDLGLRSLKYILLILFLYAVASVSAPAIEDFMSSPYGLIADVKMLNFFRELGLIGGSILGLLVVLSVFIQNFWCRYLCPYGALMGLPAMLSPLRIRRDADLCIDCGKCARACPSLLPVDRIASVRSAECTGCLECTSACPVSMSLVASLPRRRRVSASALAAGIAILFLGTVVCARWAGKWHSAIPASVYQDMIPRAGEFHHF